MQWRRLVDSRLLVWVLLWALATGAVLMLWFDADAGRHAASQPSWAAWLRAAHATSTALLVVGAFVHAGLRLVRHRRKRRAVITGALTVLSVAVASWTGALIAQTGDAAWLLRHLGLSARVLEVAVVHMAYATLLVAIALYFHLARRRARRVFGGWPHATVASGVLLLATAALGAAPLGDSGHVATAVAVPPVPWLWAWTFVAGLALLAVGLRRRPGRRREGA